MSKCYLEISYVDNGFNKQVEPIECKRYEVEEVDRMIEDVCLLQDVNCKINGYETCFRIALMNECDEVIMYRNLNGTSLK